MMFWWWYCSRCGHHTGNQRELAWAEAARDWHVSTEHPNDTWLAYELRVSFYRFREAH